MTKALALESGEEVRLIAICPGQIDTRMMARMKEYEFWRWQLE